MIITENYNYYVAEIVFTCAKKKNLNETVIVQNLITYLLNFFLAFSKFLSFGVRYSTPARFFSFGNTFIFIHSVKS